MRGPAAPRKGRTGTGLAPDPPRPRPTAPPPAAPWTDRAPHQPHPAPAAPRTRLLGSLLARSALVAALTFSHQLVF